ncbi:MAG: spermidine/putrescine ABC transporter substrate-binding protein [Spirochaetota bacterium]
MTKKIFKALIFMVCATVVLSCGNREKELHVFNWADYMNPDVIEKFEKEYDCKVVMNYFDSNEALYAKIKAGASGYDVMFPSGYMSKIMQEQKLISELDHSKIENLKNIDKAYLKKALDSKMEYSVPYMLSYTGIAYNKKRIPDFKASWSMFERKDLAGRMTLLNDLRETIGAALKFHGYNYNTLDDKELDKAKDTVIQWKQNIAKFDVDEAKRGLSSGEFVLIHTYNGDALQLIEENSDLAFAIPEEGTAINGDDMVIPTSAKNPELAYKFINFMLSPEVAKANMEFVYYLAPNTEAQKLMDKDFMSNPVINPPKKVIDKSDVLEDLGENNLKYSKIWDQIKSAK